MEDKKTFKHISAKLSNSLEKPLELRPEVPNEGKLTNYPSTRNLSNATAIYESADIILGEKACMTGEIASAERMIIAGDASINATNLEYLKIFETGKVKGNIITNDCDIEGLFEGQLEVKGTLRLKNTAQATGEISYKNLVTEKGARLSGKISALPQETH